LIDVAEVLSAMPQFESFCSVSGLHALVESLRTAPGFTVEIAGSSENGLPIHHVRYGSGPVKALFVWPVHANEPIGGLTVHSLLTLLRQGNRALTEAGVEWHIVPCIDPDGALLNEGWTQQPLDHRTYLRNHHRQEPCDQVERSFPVKHKRLVFDRPSNEAKILRALLDELRPDFFYSLHDQNAVVRGAFAATTHDLGAEYSEQLHRLLLDNDIPLSSEIGAADPLEGPRAHFAAAITEHFDSTKLYDFLEGRTSFPEQGLHGGGGFTPEYLAEIKPSAQTFILEVPLARHPMTDSPRPLAQNLRQLMLRVDADSKYVVTVLLEEWDKTKDDLDTGSHLYRKTVNGIVTPRETLAGGLPCWPLGTLTTWDILFSPVYDKPMTESDLLNVYMTQFYVLCNAYEFVRLLKASSRTPAVEKAVERLDKVFGEALDRIDEIVGFDRFKPFDCTTLARVQLGGGLIGLNAYLAGAGS
jgi:hypothetical protein